MAIRILLVEDNPGDVRLTQEALQEFKTPCSLQIATDGENAIECLRKSAKNGKQSLPDIILLDLNLPKMNGHEVLEEVKTNPLYKTIPIIVLSASKSQEDINRAYGLGANAYIAKPLDIDSYFSTMKALEDFWLRSALRAVF